MNNREKERDDGVWKSVVVLLVVLLLCGIGYIVKVSLDIDEVNSQLSLITTEKDSLLKELTAIRDSYDKCISDGDAMSQELEAEREKVAKLMYSLRRCGGGNVSVYKKKVAELQSKLVLLMQENARLQASYDSIYKILRIFQMADEVKPEEDSIVEEMQEIIPEKKEIKFSVSNIKAQGFKSKPSGNKQMKKAKKINVLEVTFNIVPDTKGSSNSEDEEVPDIELNYYVKITDPKGTVLGGSTADVGGNGDDEGGGGGGRSEKYSIQVSENYNGESIPVSARMNVRKLPKGKYSIVVFDTKGKTAGESSFTLE